EGAADIIGNNNATLQGGTTYVVGEVGQAFHFDGSTGYFQAPTTGLPTGSSDRTMELWFNAESFNYSETLLAAYGSFGVYGAAYDLAVLNENGEYRLIFTNWGEYFAGPALEPNQWYHVAVTNVGDAVTLYLDGAAVASESLYLDTPADGQFY